jgi:SAM-dependent methyltransferase
LLDVGCNWGRWSIAAARAGYRVVGIDPSLGAIAAARRVSEQMGLSASFCVGDARALPFAAESFDAAFSYSVLQHFAERDAAQALDEVGRVLREGGLATVQMANALGARSLYHQARRGFRQPRDFEVRYWTPPALKRAFESRIGPTQLSVDCYFGLGLQPGDAALLSLRARSVIAASEAMRRVAARVPSLGALADSVYLTATRSGPRAASRT